METSGQNKDIWANNWAKLSVESEIQMWDFYGGRPWVLKFTPRHGKVVEAGCGLGRYNFYLSHFGIDMIGLDFSKDTIELLNEWKQKNKYQLSFIEGDITALPFEDNSLSGYLSFGVVEHFIEGPQLPLKEAYRVLRPGGIAIISTPNKSWSKAYSKLKGRLKTIVKRLIGRKISKKVFFQYEYTPSQLRNFVNASGLTVTHYSGSDFLYTFTELGIRVRKTPKSLPWFFRFSKFMDNTIIRNIGAQSTTISVKVADKMHCFLCDELTAQPDCLETYTVPICAKCQTNKIEIHYRKSAPTYFHNDYKIFPQIAMSKKLTCDFCSHEYLPDPVFETFGFSKHVCHTCLMKKDINLDLSNNYIQPIWRSKVILKK